VNLFLLGPLPALIGQDRPLAKQLLVVHETVGLLLLGLIALHALAALYHHFWRRDGTLEAMLPAGIRRRVTRMDSARPHERRLRTNNGHHLGSKPRASASEINPGILALSPGQQSSG
jgi:Prokaryotic cytochrome b561